MRVADIAAGLSIAGLLLPEAVAYSSIAGQPPQAGVIALLAGLLAYGLLGSSRFAVVSATSSSAAVLFAATHAPELTDAGLRQAFGVGLVVAAGLLFGLAGLARLGAVSSLVAKPVLRGFAFGLALTIVVKQLPKVLAVAPAHGDFFRLLADLATDWRGWNLAGAAFALGALLVMRLLARWPVVPGALVVIAAGVVFDAVGLCHAWGVPVVGAIHFELPVPGLPALDRPQWLHAGELALALVLILYAESYGSIRTFALRHGDAVSPNRDLLALGAGNLLSGLLQGLPVGAGYSATSANEAAGAQSRLSGLVAGGVVLLAVVTLLPWIARIPEPVLAAVVIHAVGHTLRLEALRPYFAWRRDRIVAVTAVAAVLALGVLDGLLVAVGVSVVLFLQRVSHVRVAWLGRLGDGHDFVDTGRHPEAAVPAGLLIARPEVPLFFGNAEAVMAQVGLRAAGVAGLKRVVLSLEETADLDATGIEALCDFAQHLHAQGVELVLARVKDTVRDTLDRVAAPALPSTAYAPWSVDDAVAQA